jgi:hypothetical protein
VLGRTALGVLDGACRPVGEQADHIEADFEQPGPEPVLPQAQDGRDRQRRGEPVHGSFPADQRQDIGGPVGRDQADARGGQRAEHVIELLGLSLCCSAAARPGNCRLNGLILNSMCCLVSSSSSSSATPCSCAWSSR